MCGISGQLTWDRAPDCALVQRMTDRLAHRGPDGQGVVAIGPAVLGHRRLAILDLSPAGAQPMQDASGTCWVVFNGEIYNFLDVRKELAADGVRFRSRSDTEVILEAYRRWGVECLRRFNGMFALALWDDASKQLLLARDRLGKKPLYYHHRPDGGVLFASELTSLCEDASFERRLNLRALSQYLSLNYTLTSDAMLEGVRKLRPGHYVVFARGQAIVERAYWKLDEHFRACTPFTSIDAAADALRDLVDDAVRLRLISDVPLGLFLSGGIDSGTIAAAMAAASAPASVRSFSVGFRERGFSEVAEARDLAARLGVVHRDTIVTADLAKEFEAMVHAADEPFADTSFIPTYLLSRFAREHVTVCLAGDGGDEVFAGYETYVADALHRGLQRLPRRLVRALAATLPAALPVNFGKVSFDYKVRQFLAGHAYSAARAHYHWRTIFSEAEKQALLHPDLRDAVARADPFDEFERFDGEVSDCDALSRAQYVDIKTWLVDDILVKADRASMAHGLELRAPLLDHRVVEFAASLPADWKLHGLKKKYVLKMSQRGRLPHDVLGRPKRGFNAPVSHWLLSSFGDELRHLTCVPVGRQPLWFNPEFVRGLWADHDRGRRDNGLKLLGLIAFQLWAQRHQPSWL